MRVELSPQVVTLVRSLAPDPRRKISLALKGLAKGQGDIKPLEGALATYSRLRVAGYRVILFFRRTNQVECVFAERRSIVYEIFAEMLREKLAKER